MRPAPALDQDQLTGQHPALHRDIKPARCNFEDAPSSPSGEQAPKGKMLLLFFFKTVYIFTFSTNAFVANAAISETITIWIKKGKEEEEKKRLSE